jgi:hypothetical protein
VKVASGLWVVSSVEGSGASCAEAHGIEGERREEAGTRSAEPSLDITASVTICQVRIKGCVLNDLGEYPTSGLQRQEEGEREEQTKPSRARSTQGGYPTTHRSLSFSLLKRDLTKYRL